MNDLFISLEYNYREFEEMDSFKKKLEQQYHCQVRPKWIPSASEGAECWMEIFINSDIGEFLKNIVISGVLWDVIKYAGKNYVFTPLFNMLEKLNEDNKCWRGLKMENMTFQFDDCKVVFRELNSHFTSIVPRVFLEIARLKPIFEREVGCKVIQIVIPADWPMVEECSLPIFLDQWKVVFETGSPKMIYDFKSGKFLENI